MPASEATTPPRTLPAGPPGHFLTGHIRQWNRDPLGFLMNCARDHGDVVPIRLGPTRFLVLSHPTYVEEVLVGKHEHFGKGSSHRLTRSLLGNGLLSSEGEFWRRQRRLAQPAFHRERIAAYGEVMVAYTQRMLAGWTDGEVRDLHQEMLRLTLEIVAKTLFDADIAGRAEAVGRALATALERFDGRTSTLLLLLPTSIPTPGNLRFRRAVRQVEAVLYEIVERRRASGEDRGDLLSMLLHAQDEHGARMTDRQLRDEVMTLLFAGHETTALALTWAGYLLSQRPETAAKLYDEVDAALGGRTATVADLERLAYTEMVILEALRLYPPAPAVVREAIHDCRIGGYEVKAGTSILASQWVLHRDPRFFDDPETFDPSRWAGDLEKRLPRFAYFPFGGGPRICIGRSFAMMEAVLALATVAQRFQLTLEAGHLVRPHLALTLRPKHGVKVTLHARRGDRAVARRSAP